MCCWMALNAPYKDLQTMRWQMTITAVNKTHNLKNNLHVLPNLRIVWLSSTYPGKVHRIITFAIRNNRLFQKVSVCGKMVAFQVINLKMSLSKCL